MAGLGKQVEEVMIQECAQISEASSMEFDIALWYCRCVTLLLSAGRQCALLCPNEASDEANSTERKKQKTRQETHDYDYDQVSIDPTTETSCLFRKNSLVVSILLEQM